MNLPPHRCPPRFGGYGKDPIFALDTNALPDELQYRPDPAERDKQKGFIEPSRRMTFDEYQRAIRATRTLWRPYF
jgi:hypothetical protein